MKMNKFNQRPGLAGLVALLLVGVLGLSACAGGATTATKTAVVPLASATLAPRKIAG